MFQIKKTDKVICVKLITIALSLGLIIFSNSTNSCEEHSENKMQDVSVTDQDGIKKNIYTDMIKDKIVAINFIYTTCKHVCVPMSAVFSGVSNLIKLKKNNKNNFKLISITLDPKTDTPKKLKVFLKTYGNHSDWSLVSGDSNMIKKLLIEAGVKEEIPLGHTPFTIIGNPATNSWKKIEGIVKPDIIFNKMEELSMLDNLHKINL
jgi:protein SCO1/2